MTMSHARTLRKNATEVERRLWRHLRGRHFEAFKFRRQRAIGPYIVDFVCMERGLIVELDGGQHAEATKSHDARRDAYLKRAGYRVLRFWNDDVVDNMEGVLKTICIALDTGPHPNPLPQAGEGAGRRLAAKRREMAKARLAVSSNPGWPSETCNVRIAAERPEGPEILALLAAGDAYVAALYPAESNHMLAPDALRAPAVTFFVARLEGRAVGCAALVRQGGYGEIKRMFVDAAARGHGIGRRLLTAIEAEAARSQLPLLRLETGIRQPEAIRLYRTAGFRDIPPFGVYGPDPLSVFMEKPVRG
jgi:putative acetyltransferase